MPRYHTDRIIRHVFKIEPVEMCKPAVPTPHHDGATADREVMELGNPAVPARGLHGKGPDRPGPGSGKLPGFIYILYPGYKDPGCPASHTGDIRPVGHRLDVLICYLPAVVTVGAVISTNEPVAHEGWCIHGIIKLSQVKNPD
jgi:hypothetical protein